MKGQPLAKRKARKARNNTAPSSLLTTTEGNSMSSIHKLKVEDLQTLEHLREYVEERLYGSTVVLDGYEVVIRTGMGIDLGNILYPLNEEE